MKIKTEKSRHRSPVAAPSKTAAPGTFLQQQNRQSIQNVLRQSSPLSSSETSNAYEQQADTIAIQAMGQDGIKEEQQNMLSPAAPSSIAKAIPSVGQPLGGALRTDLESSFGRSLAHVRVHHNDVAAAATQSVQAKAFATGRDIYFSSDSYAPTTGAGRFMLAHEIAHTMQPQQTNTIRRWAGHEHKAFGDLAGRMVAGSAGKFTQGVQTLAGLKSTSGIKTTKGRKAASKDSVENNLTQGLKKDGFKGTIAADTVTMDYTHRDAYCDGDTCYDVDKEMSLGTASKLSGDHRQNIAELTKTTYGSDTLGGLNPHYLSLASTNYTHFFPLANKEWSASHAIAMKHAKDANKWLMQAGRESNPKTKQQFVHIANSKVMQATQAESFALHFLQDSFASGHQYPRALDTVPDNTNSSMQSKTFHDLLCALGSGLHIFYKGGTRKFHGDNTADSSDSPVALESYNSLAQVYCTAFGVSPSTVNAVVPTLAQGPDVKSIMQDKDASPIWYALETQIQKKNLATKIGQTKYSKKKISIDSGQVVNEPSQADVMLEWQRVHTQGGSTVDPASQHKPNDVDSFMVSVLSDPGMLQTDLDDNLVKYLRANKWQLPKGISKEIVVKILEFLIGDGDIPNACIGDDEKAFYKIMSSLSRADFTFALNKFGLARIDSSLDGDWWDFFLALTAFRHVSGRNNGANAIYKEKNDNAARILVGWCDSNSAYFNLMTDYEWIGIIKALLSGSCGDDDEDAIIKIIRHLINRKQTKLIDAAIGENAMDSGVDGAQWRTIVKMINKAPDRGYVSWSVW